MLPDDGARSKIQAQQLPLLHALLHAAVIGSIAIAIAIESALETGVRFAAHRGGHEDAVTPHDGTGMRQSRNGSLPGDVGPLPDIPGHREFLAVGGA